MRNSACVGSRKYLKLLRYPLRKTEARGTNLQICCNAAFCRSMKAVLTMTSRGVVTLPAKLREFLGIKADDQLIAETTPEGLLLRPAVTLPIEIYGKERVREFEESEGELAAFVKSKKAAH